MTVDPVSLAVYGATCGTLCALAPRFGRMRNRVIAGTIVGIAVAGILPAARGNPTEATMADAPRPSTFDAILAALGLRHSDDLDFGWTADERLNSEAVTEASRFEIDTAFQEKYGAGGLSFDYSYESLRGVRQILDAYRAAHAGGAAGEAEDTASAIVRLGCYVGEVVRQQAKTGLTWTTPEHLDDRQKRAVTDLGVPAIHYVLVDADGQVIADPLRTIADVLDRGGADRLDGAVRAMVTDAARRARG